MTAADGGDITAGSDLLARGFTAVALAASAVAALGALAGAPAASPGAGGRWGWAFDLINHFPAWVLILGVVAAVIAVRAGRAGLAAVALAAALPWGARWYQGFPPVHRADVGQPVVTIALANVLTRNEDASRLRAWLEEVDADVIALVEVDARWIAELAPVLDRYAHRVEVPRSDNFGVALAARVALREATAETSPAGLPTVRAVLPGGTPLHVVHTMPPAGARAARVRDLDLAAWADALRGTAIVVGDLNTTPWSAAFPLPGAPVAGGTWPAMLPFALRLPLDHVLAAGGARVAALEVGPPIGSDHLPVLATVALPP